MLADKYADVDTRFNHSAYICPVSCGTRRVCFEGTIDRRDAISRLSRHQSVYSAYANEGCASRFQSLLSTTPLFSAPFDYWIGSLGVSTRSSPVWESPGVTECGQMPRQILFFHLAMFANYIYPADAAKV